MKKMLYRASVFISFFLILVPLESKAVVNQLYKLSSLQKQDLVKIVGSVPDANISLYASEKEGNLGEFKLHANGDSQFFPSWKNVSNPTYRPNLFYSDINQDGKNELIIVLTTGYGTGIILQEVHVLQKIKTNMGEIFKEVLVDNPMAIILKNVQTKLTKSEAIINTLNKKTIIKLDKLGIKPDQLFSDISMKNLIEYDIVNNKLTAIIGAQISPVGGYIGSFHITYTFKDKMYQVKKIEFIQ
ncbi:hypothetical protein ACOI1C_11720 [Bacillus sp. DJP31]|uniref:hypothetical protein n=1 Tax=Bacillus sp. DJP31 TaxID=3409789 RepID=UPI003BB71368